MDGRDFNPGAKIQVSNPSRLFYQPISLPLNERLTSIPLCSEFTIFFNLQDCKFDMDYEKLTQDSNLGMLVD